MIARAWVLRILQILGQMRTAVLLLGLCALASMAGTIVVQGLPIQDYVAEYGVFGAQVLWYSGMTDVFRAWWFVGILAFLLVSVSVCVVRNGPGIGRSILRVRRVPDLRGKGIEATGEGLKQAGFRQIGTVEGVEVWQRGVMNRIGYFLVHVGVLGVAVAGLISGFVGWRGSLNLREGEADKVVLVWKGVEATPHFLPFMVENKAFEIEHYPSGMPKRYATHLEMDGRTREVEVNHPVRVGDYAFYQASFGDGGSRVKGRGVNLADGAVVPFEGQIYERSRLSDGTRVELLDFRPFTVETFPGMRPTDVGPSLDYLVQPVDAPAVQLRAYLSHPDMVGVADGQQIGGQNDGAVVYRPVRVGVPAASGLEVGVWWRMVARLVAGEDMKHVAGSQLAGIKDETVRVATGLALLQSAKIVQELGLTHLLVLEDFELKRYSGLQVAYDPGANLFWLFSSLLVLGVVLMLGRKFSRVFVKDGRAYVTSPHGVRVVREVEEELASPQ